MSWMCSIHIRSRHTLPNHHKGAIPNVVVLNTGAKQPRNTQIARQVLKNASTCTVIKMKHPLVALFVTLLQQCDIIHTR